MRIALVTARGWVRVDNFSPPADPSALRNRPRALAQPIGGRASARRVEIG
jgi:hypothetical protein